MNGIINSIIGNFDWAYMLSVNVLTYIITKLIDTSVKFKTPSWLKKLVSLFSVISVAGCYYLIDKTLSLRILLNSAILAPVAWDFVFKPLLDRIGLNYKDE
mgnify:CR=1 FL=1